MPFSAQNPELPHPAHEGARVTLKGVIQNASCSRGGADYSVWWDADRDGDFDDEWRRDVERHGTTHNVRDIGRTFLVPSVPRDQSLNITVRVRNNCDANVETRDQFGTYRLFVYDFTLSNDPVNWTQEQLEIATVISLHESMWWHHRNITSFSARDTANIRAQMNYRDATGIALWQFTINGRLPAYPPGTYNTHGHPVPDGWQALNDSRWANDPYAETTMRLTNEMSIDYRYAGINRADEENTCGFDANGVARSCIRLGGTADARGVYSRTTNTYRTGIHTGVMATVLPAFAGTRVQNGQVSGELWENVIQQQADFVSYQQIDSGDGQGGWYYRSVNGAGSASWSDASTSQWSYIGLESAEIAGGPYGVFVNNRAKYRIAANLVRNQRGDWHAGYRSNSGRGDLKLTGGALVGARWLGIHQFELADNTPAFPGVVGHTRGALRLNYDRYIAALLRDWTAPLSRGSHWADSLWRLGDYLCGNRNGVYDAGRCGSTYAMYSLQKGFRTGQPELDRVGVHDWYRQFSIYYNRAMYRGLPDPNDGLANYGNFGFVRDDYCDNHSVTCSYGSGQLAAAMAGLVLTPSIFRPKPVAAFEPGPPVVTEGCSGGNNGVVTFDHSGSFHPNVDSRIIAYQYDVDPANGLWWETGADPDVQVGGANPADSVEYRFMRHGVFVVTLRVVDQEGAVKTTTRAVTVNEADNVPPSVVHGGPYSIEAGQDLQLRGVVTDGNAGCGDRITVGWDLDGDGDFSDAIGANPLVDWDDLPGADPGQAIIIRMRAVDEFGAETFAETTLVFYPAEPVAQGRANPNPAACQQVVTFDGSASFHPNPERQIVSWEWDVDGQGGVDGAGQNFRYTYPRFGTYNIALTVRDDLGRSHSMGFPVAVTQGNAPPVARLSRNEYFVVEGDALSLDARGSSEPNDACGDSIQEFLWDLDGDGDFDDAVGTTPEIPWASVAQFANFDAANAPISINIKLKVVDSFGLEAEADATVTLLSSQPVAVITQTPNPSPINLVTGRAVTRFDARESTSPIPGVGIARFDWDLNDDGVFETTNRPVVDHDRVFDPVPGPANIPDVFVRLRITDEDGRVGEVRRRVVYRVPPTPPTADADPTDPPEQGYDLLLGDRLTLDASQSFDPDADEFGDFLAVYRWELDHDPAVGFQPDFEIDDVNGDAQEAQFELTPVQLAAAGIDRVGTFTVMLQVEDNTLLTNQDFATLRVYPRNPEAVAVAGPAPAACEQRVTFDASGSNHPHPGVDVVAYRWDLDGDGEYDDAEGEVVAHRFSSYSFGAPHAVGLQVEDSNGNLSTTQIPVDVNVGNHAPVANAGGTRDGDGNVVGPYLIAQGDALDLSAQGSGEPDAACGDSIVRYQWDIDNDGTFDIEGDDPDAITWADLQGLGIDGVGDHEIRLRVTDRFGVTGDGVVTLRVVEGPQASVVARPNRASCNQLITFDASASSTDGPEADGFALVSFEWDLDGDGQFDDAVGEQVVRPAVGLPNGGPPVMTVAVRVTDATGRVDIESAQVDLDVQNLPPVADAGGPYSTGPQPGGFAPVFLDARGSSDPNAPCDGIGSYRWDMDGDGIYGAADGEPEGAQVAYENPAWRVGTIQTVSVIVCDLAGVCSPPAEAQIGVLAVAPPNGEVLSPRADANDCVPAGDTDVALSVAHPDGLQVTATVHIAGIAVGSQIIQTNADGSRVPATITINPNLVPEGRHEIVVELSSAGAIARIESGGRLPFDRTAPTIDIENVLQAGVCYQPNNVPDPVITVDDGLDPVPLSAVAVEANGCGRALVVRATDACGNEATAERAYLLAQPVEMTVLGAEEGELVSTARMSWDVDGDDQCAANITATVSRNGGAAAPYPESELINQPGNYALLIRAENCAGVPRNIGRSFAINAPPVAVPVPAGHPQIDLDVGGGLTYGYEVTEGEALTLDASDSLPPEAIDEFAAFNWDLDNDGEHDDAQGETAPYNTDTDGVFRASLEVVDSLGAATQVPFQITVTDVAAVVDAGGPYIVDEGLPFEFDASGTQPGSDADPILSYRWEWGDGTFTEGPDETNPTHIYDREGIYTLRLIVTDEDGQSVVDVRVEVRDVDPTVGAIIPPEDALELYAFDYGLEAEAGSPADPLTRIEWDFDGDGAADCIWAQAGGVPADKDCAGQNGTNASRWYRDSGRKEVTVTVYDTDSSSSQTLELDVREITLAEMVTYADEQVTLREAGPLDPFTRRELTGFHDVADDAAWGERNDRRGNTLVAIDKMVSRMARAQARGADFSLSLWAMSRQLMRETTRLRAQIMDDDNGPGEDHRSFQRATAYLDQLIAEFGDDEFEADVYSGDFQRIGRAHAVWQQAYEAYFWLRDSVDPCAADGFFLPAIDNPVDRTRAGNAVNERLTEALGDLSADMTAYTEDGDGDAPGRAAVLEAIQGLAAVRALQQKPVTIFCEPGEECVTDSEALEMLVTAMDIANELDGAANDGAYHRQWQSCMVEAVRFRVEISLLRVEFVCGQNSGVAQTARGAQRIGLDFYAEGQKNEAMQYYKDNDQRCMMVDVYNACLHRSLPDINPVYARPDECQEDPFHFLDNAD